MNSVPASPFARVMVPYDGSEPASAALSVGLGLAVAGAKLLVLSVVDELAVMAQVSSEGPWPVDRSPLLAALDAHAQSVLDAAKGQARARGVEPELELLHDVPVVAIAQTAKDRGCDLIVMGTHARTGLSRLFLGSTTDGVLRASEVPVLAVRHPATSAEWKRVLVAVDDSDPADAGLRLARKIIEADAAALLLCHAANTHHTREMAAMYGYDPALFIAEERAEAREVIDGAAARAQLPPGSFETVVVEGAPAEALAAAAADASADIVVMGSHGRRGLQRLMLGSVAEQVVRNSPVPVLVVRK